MSQIRWWYATVLMLCVVACGDDDANGGGKDAGAGDAAAEDAATSGDAGQDSAVGDAGSDAGNAADGGSDAGDASVGPDNSEYTIGGEVQGLTGGELSLETGAGEVLKLTQSGAYTFNDELKSGDAYVVTVKACRRTQLRLAL